MKYYSEDTVYELMSAAEECATSYEFGVHKRVNINDYPSIDIKEPHGRCIDVDALPIKDEWSLVGTDVIWDAPTILEASPSTDGFCNTEGCSNSKPDMTKAQNHLCPYYKGVCSLDERIICYCQHHYEICDKFIEVSKQ